jgi:hypothetical protein
MNKIILAVVLSTMSAPSWHAYADPLQAPVPGSQPGDAAPQQHSFGGSLPPADPPVAAPSDIWNEAWHKRHMLECDRMPTWFGMLVCQSDID